MVVNSKGLLLAALLAALPAAASASTASEIAEKINWCQMKDPVGLTHLFSVKGDQIVLRDEGETFVGVTSTMPISKMVFDFQPRSFNPDYGAILSAKCKDGDACVEVKRDNGPSWRSERVQVFVQVECGKALDLAGKSLPY
jgi:hypothetical protein